MSVSSYLTKNIPDLKMSKTETGTDDLGIRYEGPVLSGLMGVRQNLQQNAVNSPQTDRQIREIAPGGVNYLEPSPSIRLRQDPRLEPDPLLAAQRDRLAPHEPYDPVLRHHAGLPPLPDPYEKQRLRAENWEKERNLHVIR